MAASGLDVRDWFRRARWRAWPENLRQVWSAELRLTAGQRPALDVLLDRLALDLPGDKVFEALRHALRPAEAASLCGVLDWLCQAPGTTPALPSAGGTAAPRRRNILFITGEFPSPLHGGGRRVLEFIQLMGREHNLYLYAAGYQAAPPAERQALAACCQRVGGTLTHAAFEQAGRKVRAFVAGVPIDIVHYEWPRSLRLLDHSLGKHHLFTYMECVSLSRRRQLDRHAPFSPGWLQSFVGLLGALKVELVDAARAEARIAVSENDQRFLARLNPASLCRVINHGVTPDHFCLPDLAPEANTLVFVGNFLHYPNEEALGFLLDQVMPIVWAQMPNARLFLVGAHPSIQTRRRHDGRRVIVTGQVPDVRRYIQKAAVCIAPLLSGAGLRGKVIQYAALRRPCVATTLAAAGLAYVDGEEILVADTPGNFAQHILILLGDPVRAARIGRAAYAKALALYDNRELVRQLYALYSELETERRTHSAIP